MASLLSAVSSHIVSFADGSVDWDATLNGIQAVLCIELETSRENDTALEAALDRLFDRVPVGAGIPTPIAIQTACSEIAGGDFSKLQSLMPACEALIGRSNRFQSKRGRNGGLFRVISPTT